MELPQTEKNEKEKDMKIEKSYSYIYLLDTDLNNRIPTRKKKGYETITMFKCQVYCCNL
jgi:hypothetical protein